MNLVRVKRVLEALWMEEFTLIFFDNDGLWYHLFLTNLCNSLMVARLAAAWNSSVTCTSLGYTKHNRHSSICSDNFYDYMDAILILLAFWNPLSDLCNSWGHLSEIVFINGVCDAFHIVTCSKASSVGLVCHHSQQTYFSVVLFCHQPFKTWKFNMEMTHCALDWASCR